MSSYNHVTLIGRLGADPEVKTFQDGGKICNLRVATSERWKDKATGEQREKTEWHAVVLKAEGLVRVAESYLRKGSNVFLTGKLETRKWQDQGGQARYTTEVIVGPFDGKLVLIDPPKGGGHDHAATAAVARADAAALDLDDDIPF